MHVGFTNVLKSAGNKSLFNLGNPLGIPKTFEDTELLSLKFLLVCNYQPWETLGNSEQEKLIFYCYLELLYAEMHVSNDSSDIWSQWTSIQWFIRIICGNLSLPIAQAK